MAFIAVFIAVVVGVVSAQTQGRCGEQPITTRIIGGTNILRCQQPFRPLIAIKIFFDASPNGDPLGNLTICGGALVNDQYVLTTASCAAPMYGPSNEYLRSTTRIIVGDFDTETSNTGNDGTPEDVIPVEDVRIHFAYNDITFDNNIAIIKLAYPVRYNNCKQPACLLPTPDPSSSCNTPEVDGSCIMAAVGIRQQEPLVYSNIPQQAPLKLFSSSLTDFIVKTSGNDVPVGAVLAETYDTNVQTCMFDVGGIVVCFKDERYWLRGLISTNNCVLSSDPRVRTPPIFVTEVSMYREWIDQCVQNLNCPSLPY